MKSNAPQNPNDANLTIRDHMDPDKHWIGETLPAPTQGDLAGTVGTVSGPGDSPFPARADHMHKVDPALLAQYLLLTGGQIDGTLKIIGNPNALMLARAGTTAPFLSFYDPTFATRYSFVQGTAAGMSIVDETNVFIRFNFNSPNVESFRMVPNGMLFGKNTINTMATVEGAEIWASSGQMFSTTTAVSSNQWLVHIGAADAANMAYTRYYRAGSVILGSVAQVSTTGVVYNTTSHGPWKDNVQDLDDDEALARVDRWRPVSFQWKFDENGVQSENGTPGGEVNHGFIAQELNEVQPSAVTPGYGDEADMPAWIARRDAALAADKEFNEPEPFMPWGMSPGALVPDLVAAFQALTRKVADLTARVEELETV
jgi:hypothetical protein